MSQHKLNAIAEPARQAAEDAHYWWGEAQAADDDVETAAIPFRAAKTALKEAHRAYAATARVHNFYVDRRTAQSPALMKARAEVRSTKGPYDRLRWYAEECHEREEETMAYMIAWSREPNDQIS